MNNVQCEDAYNSAGATASRATGATRNNNVWKLHVY